MVEVSGARVIVVLGSIAKKAILAEYALETDEPNLLDMGNKNRWLAFLPHPNAHSERSFASCVAVKILNEIQKALKH